LGRLVGGVWSGFTWLRIGTVGGLLWMRWWTFRFWRHGVSYLVCTAWLAASTSVGCFKNTTCDLLDILKRAEAWQYCLYEMTNHGGRIWLHFTQLIFHWHPPVHECRNVKSEVFAAAKMTLLFSGLCCRVGS
jgi:hypothetical protein